MGSETLEPDQYLGPKRYKITVLCYRCSKEFSYITQKLTAKDRPCPRKACKTAALREDWEKEQANLAQMLEEQRPPGQIGNNASTKAVDMTAEIVMRDHGMTDLKDNIRTGESMAPKLPPAMQQAADNMFSKNPLQNQGMGSKQAEMIKRRALAGAYRNMAINPGIVGGTTGESPMRKVREERWK